MIDAATAHEGSPTQASAGPEPAVRVSMLNRNFGPVKALSDVSFDVRKGEVTALLGENGAGKSTLLKILAGLQPPSSGSVTVHGGRVTSFDPSTMLTTHGVAIVPQELALANDRSVAHNITMGVEPGGRLFPSRSKMEAEASALLADLGVTLDPRIEVQRLNLATQQLVVVARSVARKCRVLILDEPTAMLTPSETKRLFDLLGRLKAAGVTIIYVSHRMPEIFALADQIHVLRDGRHVASMRTAATTPDAVVAAMVGRELGEALKRGAKHHGETDSLRPALAVAGLSGRSHRDVSFTVRPGEILGVAGLPDSGRVELLRNIFGSDPATAGTVHLAGEPYTQRTPAQSIKRGLAYVPGERRAQGLLSSMSVAENIGVLSLDKFSRFGIINKIALRKDTEARSGAIRVKTSSVDQEVTKLSGGNQQKAVLARWMSIEPVVFALDEPTRGVDVGAKAEIYERLMALADGGVAIVFSSSDLPELLAITDRIAVMSQGHLVSVIATKDATEESIMALATGAVLSTRESTAEENIA
jgi:ABC-type sugar transport system ATPase subunit